MKKIKKVLKTEINSSYSDILDKLSANDEENKSSIIEAALKDYFIKQGVIAEDENKETEEIEEVEEISLKTEDNLQEPVHDSLKEETHDGKKRILLMVPYYKTLWEYSDKADIIIGKRKVSEVYEYNTFLGFKDNDIKEFKTLTNSVENLKISGRTASLVKSQKNKITVNYDEIKNSFEKFKNLEIAILRGKDKTFTFIETDSLKPYLKEIYKDKEIEFIGGNNILMLNTKEELLNFFQMYNSLYKKLGIITDKIIEGYKPIDKKWVDLTIEKQRDIKALNSVLQVLSGTVIFIVITLIFIFIPEAFYMPLINEIMPRWRYFVAAYLLTFPVLVILINYIIIYTFWYQTRLIFIRKSVKKLIETDLKNLREKVGIEVFK